MDGVPKSPGDEGVDGPLVLYLIDSQTSENMPGYFYICFIHSRKGVG